ncbi:hypothetical protein [Bradyrhizobium sp. 604_D8_N2_3]|uniref:hypothetical protein n=1 Tax=Bradyrhizobium sp. 604_D8_N2_3 TaxID=3240370 RepID=UPI003F29E959
MAVNKPTGDSARKGAVKKRSQTKATLGGASAFTKARQGVRRIHRRQEAREGQEGRKEI